MAKKQLTKTPSLAQWRKQHPRAGTVSFSIRGTVWGGLAYAIAKRHLDLAGIPHQKTGSPFVGHWSIDVPKMFQRKASRILL